MFLCRVFGSKFDFEVNDTVTMVSNIGKNNPEFPELTVFGIFPRTAVEKGLFFDHKKKTTLPHPLPTPWSFLSLQHVYRTIGAKIQYARFQRKEKTVVWEMYIWNQRIKIRRNGHPCFYWPLPTEPPQTHVYSTMEKKQACTKGVWKKPQKCSKKTAFSVIWIPSFLLHRVVGL